MISIFQTDTLEANAGLRQQVTVDNRRFYGEESSSTGTTTTTGTQGSTAAKSWLPYLLIGGIVWWVMKRK